MLDQTKVDLNLRRHGDGLNQDVWALAGRTPVNPATISAQAVNIVFFGQSTNNNSIVPTGYVPQNPGAVFNLAMGARGTVFAVKSPLLGSDLIEDHHGMWLADQIIAAGVAPQVVLTVAALGGSYCADWAPGGGSSNGVVLPAVRSGALAYRIGVAARAICNAGLDNLPTIIDWQQGEWDSDGAGTSETDYATALKAVIDECKRVGLLRSGRCMFVHLCTRITNPAAARNTIRAAQASVCDGVLVWQGADIDTLGASYRQADGTHFLPTGAGAQAALKLPFYQAFLTS